MKAFTPLEAEIMCPVLYLLSGPEPVMQAKRLSEGRAA